MQKKRPSLSSFLIGLATGVLPLQVAALEFGPAPQSIALGQPLDFSVPLRLEPGESTAPDCTIADVTLGDEHLPAPLVRTRLERTDLRSAVIRVTSSQAVNEPLVTVELSVGCASRMTRRFVVLADPSLAPASATPPVALPAAEPMREAPPPRAAVPAPASTARAAEPAQPVSRAAPSSAPPTAGKPEGTRAAPPAPRVDNTSQRVRARASEPAAAAQERPRLRMDVVEPTSTAAKPLATIVEEALQAIEAAAQSASATGSAAAAASTPSARMAALEKTVLDLHKESQAQRELMLQMQAQLLAAETANRWIMPLSIMLAGLTGLAGWLAWRVRQMQRENRPSGPPSDLPVLAPGVVPDDEAISLPPNYESTSPPSANLNGGSPRDVSIEELIDLEQQAEFFIALGQEESAVELLTDHLRNSEGGSPLAYLKLLEIYKRRDDRAAYERIRIGFNQRFNAYAPVWEADLQAGLVLEDYPEVVQQLQKVWPRPLAAMAELGMLIFHTTRGDVFDLPAYRDVLFLYALARDLSNHDEPTIQRIALMSPLPEVSEFSDTAPHVDPVDDRLPTIEAADSELPTTMVDLVDLDLHLDLDLETSSTVQIQTATAVDTDALPELDLDLDLSDPLYSDRKIGRQ